MPTMGKYNATNSTLEVFLNTVDANLVGPSITLVLVLGWILGLVKANNLIFLALSDSETLKRYNHWREKRR